MLMRKIAEGLFRHFLTILAGYLIAKGLVPGGSEADLINGIMTLVAGGALSTLQKESLKGALLGLGRHLLTALAGYAATKGWVSPELSIQLVAWVTSLLTGVVGVRGSVKEKIGSRA